MSSGDPTVAIAAKQTQNVVTTQREAHIVSSPLPEFDRSAPEDCSLLRRAGIDIEEPRFATAIPVS